MNGVVSPVLERCLKRELAPGEQILWSATPSVWKDSGAYLVIFLTGLALFFEYWLWNLSSRVLASFHATHPSGDLLIRVLLILGVILTILIPLSIWWKAWRTLFVVTDRRAILLHAIMGCRVRSFSGEQLLQIERTENRRGDGSIHFGYRWAFWGIADTRHVAQVLRGVAENGTKIASDADAKTAENRWPSQTWRFVVIGIAGSMVNLTLAFFLLPRFAKIFHDMLQEGTLPWSAQAVLNGKWAFAVAAFLWPIAAFGVGRLVLTAGQRIWWYLVGLAAAILIQFLVPSGILLSLMFRMLSRLGGSE